MKRLLAFLLTIIITFSSTSIKITAETEMFGDVLEPMLDYSDINYNYYAEKLSYLNVFKGTSSGYELQRSATRLEGIILLLRMLGKEDDALQNTSKSVFSDVPAWGVPYANYAYEIGLTKGVGNGKFGTNSPLTTEAFFTFTLRALGYTEDDFISYIVAPLYAMQPGKTFDVSDGLANALLGEVNPTITRGQIAYFVYETLLLIPKDSNRPLLLDLIDSGDITNTQYEKFLGNPEASGHIDMDSAWYNFYADEKVPLDIDYDYAMYDTILEIKAPNVKIGSTITDTGFTINAYAIDTLFAFKYTYSEKFNYYKKFNDMNQAQIILIDLQKFSQEGKFQLLDFDFSMYTPMKINDTVYEDSTVHLYNKVYISANQNEYVAFDTPTKNKDNGVAFYHSYFDLQRYVSTFKPINRNQAITEKALELTADLSSDSDKLKAIYEWIGRNIEYDVEYYYNNGPLSAYSAIDVFEKEVAVCSGYSRLAKNMLESVGIPTIVATGSVTSSGNGHAWNMSYIDGQWLTHDPTWSSPVGVDPDTGIGYNLDTFQWKYFDINFDDLYKTRTIESIYIYNY